MVFSEIWLWGRTADTTETNRFSNERRKCSKIQSTVFVDVLKICLGNHKRLKMFPKSRICERKK